MMPLQLPNRMVVEAEEVTSNGDATRTRTIEHGHSTAYWLGSGHQVPTAADFEYSQTFVDNRQLENLSWDVWTLSPIDYTSMVDRKSTRLNSSHLKLSRMPSSA